MTTKITGNNITSGSITVTQLVTGLISNSPKITSVQITNSSYTVLDDTAANTLGGFIQITGSNLPTNCSVIVGVNVASSVTFVNTSVIRAQVAAAAAATYPIYVVNTDDGATAIRVNGLTYSAFPAWGTGGTLANQSANTSFGVALSATSDSSIIYSVAAGSSLPAGTTLAANGFFSGTVSIESQTTYSFDVKATDTELQDTSRTFSLTVTVIPPYYLFSWGKNNNGSLGLNDIVYRSSPTQVGVTNDWNIIKTAENAAIGLQFTMAIKNNGTMWSWGRGVGGLGQNDTVNRSSPVQLGTDTSWDLVAAGSYSTAVIAQI